MLKLLDKRIANLKGDYLADERRLEAQWIRQLFIVPFRAEVEAMRDGLLVGKDTLQGLDDKLRIRVYNEILAMIDGREDGK